MRTCWNCCGDLLAGKRWGMLEEGWLEVMLLWEEAPMWSSLAARATWQLRKGSASAFWFNVHYPGNKGGKKHCGVRRCVLSTRGSVIPPRESL